MRQQDLFTTRTDHAVTPTTADEYDCPQCGRRVRDTYVEGDALCCWCRDINDPRLSHRIRDMRIDSAAIEAALEGGFGRKQ